MAQALLVETDRKVIAKLIEVADEQKLDLRIILIAKFEDYYTPRLVLCSPAFGEHRELFNYKHFGSILRESGLYGQLPSPLLIESSDPLDLAIRQRFGLIESERGIAFSDQSLGDRFVEDGVIFRIR